MTLKQAAEDLDEVRKRPRKFTGVVAVMVLVGTAGMLATGFLTEIGRGCAAPPVALQAPPGGMREANTTEPVAGLEARELFEEAKDLYMGRNRQITEELAIRRLHEAAERGHELAAAMAEILAASPVLRPGLGICLERSALGCSTTIETYPKTLEFAENGDSDALFIVGMANLLACNPSQQRDEKQAAEWFHKAAGKHNPLATAHLGLMVAQGQGQLDKQPQDGIAWLQKAAEAGNARAWGYLGEYYRLKSKPEFGKVEENHLRAAAAGFMYSIKNLCNFYQNPQYGPCNDDAAVRWCAQTRDRGSEAGARIARAQNKVFKHCKETAADGAPCDSIRRDVRTTFEACDNRGAVLDTREAEAEQEGMRQIAYYP